MCAEMKRIGTHDGTFHCDEVLACFLLRKLPEYVCSEVIRTRDESVLKTCDVVVDVGGVYDPGSNRFDHHQSTFASTMNSLNPAKPWKVKLSSAGLVYHHFGEQVLRAILGPSHDPEIIPKLFDYVYENFVQEVDGIDNGVEMYDGEPLYRIHTNLSSRIANLNKPWNSKEAFDSQKVFHNAMDLAGREFIDIVQYFVKSCWPARKIVSDALSDRFKTHSSGEIVELPTFCPWGRHLRELEQERDLVGTVKYVIFSDPSSWSVRAVAVSPSSFTSRLPLPKEWQGLRDEELCKVSGIDGCIFCHVTGFIGKNKTREGALAMAVKSLMSQQLQQ